MPRLAGIVAAPQTTAIDFFVSVPLDLMNSMYFTHLAKDHEGLEGWATETRKNMAPELLAEFDFLYDFPFGEPGLLGTLGDMLWNQPQTWASIDALLDYVRNLPAGIGTPESGLGIEGLAFNVTNCDIAWPDLNNLTNEQLVSELEARGLEVAPILALLERPEELRERMAIVIERVYNEHYKPDLPRRLPCLERSVAAYKGTVTMDNIIDTLKQISGRDHICIEPDGVCAGPWKRLQFAPSLDMGPYMSCAVIGSTHWMFYPCESRFVSGDVALDESVRMARLYKALSDEQRLRILEILREREMYAQEIVDRTGLHQSMVSRHLGFLKAVGLVHSRRDGTMKFFSLNTDIRKQLARTLELFPEGDSR
jgi:DNA-binding transcriptional ArsR family regulator